MEYEKWNEILAPYEHAVEELKIKFKNIRKEYLAKGEYSPIEFVTGRTKKISSIISKLKRINAKDIETEIDDIAGIRIMCQFVEDIYAIVDLIKVRNDMTIIGEKDYITNYKDSGYTIEHSLKYKYDHYIPETLAERLRRASDAAFLLDQEMSEIREDIMKAQAMYQMKSIAIRDTLNRIQELYDLGDTHKAMQYQRKLDRTETDKNITEILELKQEIDILLEQYKDTKVDDKVVQ